MYIYLNRLDALIRNKPLNWNDSYEKCYMYIAIAFLWPEYYMFKFLVHLAQSARWGIVGCWLRRPASCGVNNCFNDLLLNYHANFYQIYQE